MVQTKGTVFALFMLPIILPWSDSMKKVCFISEFVIRKIAAMLGLIHALDISFFKLLPNEMNMDLFVSHV